MLPINIRPYQTGDELQVIDLWDRCNLLVPWNDPQQDIALKLQIQPDLFLVGTLDSQVIATVMAGYEGHRGWLMGFQIDDVVSIGKRL
jgi:hypothetical protein